MLRVFTEERTSVTPDDCEAVGKGVLVLYNKIPFLFSKEKNGNDDMITTAIFNALIILDLLYFINRGIIILLQRVGF
jgi:hypothetical protein